MLTATEILAQVHRIIQHQVETLRNLAISPRYVDAVHLLQKTAVKGGRVVTTGIGKSALVAQRIAATFTVTGMPAWYLHPVDALHGDIGGVAPQDLLLIVSRSGESDEVLALDCVAQCALPTILITADPQSTLAQKADVMLLHGGIEACPYGLVPTSSLTAASVIGDVLALLLRQCRGIGADDFAALHKDGSLGRRLTLKVADVMVTGDAVGRITGSANLYAALIALAKYRGTVLVFAHPPGGELLGVVTAGDVARCCDAAQDEAEYRMNCWEVSSVMTKKPYNVMAGVLVVDAIEVMQKFGVMALPVVNDAAEIEGMIHLHDALRARVQ